MKVLFSKIGESIKQPELNIVLLSPPTIVQRAKLDSPKRKTIRLKERLNIRSTQYFRDEILGHENYFRYSYYIRIFSPKFKKTLSSRCFTNKGRTDNSNSKKNPYFSTFHFRSERNTLLHEFLCETGTFKIRHSYRYSAS